MDEFPCYLREGRTWILWSILVSSCNMAEEEVAAFVVNSGSGMHSAGLLVTMHLALCSQRLPPGWHAHVQKCAQ